MDAFSDRVAARYKRKKRLETGTVVYEYSARQIADRNRRKARRLEKLRKGIKHLRAQVKRDLRSDDPEKFLTALAVGLIDHTYERVGNEGSADEGHFGVSGWLKKHVSFGRNKATIKYVGKSGVKHRKEVTDEGLVKALRDAYEATEGPDGCLFDCEDVKVDAKKVNDYLKAFGITAKDIRGLHANKEMKSRLKAIRSQGKELPSEAKDRKKILKAEFKKALEETAKAVGHEASTLKSQYLVPGLEAQFLKDGTVSEKMHKKGHIHQLVNVSLQDFVSDFFRRHPKLKRFAPKKVEHREGTGTHHPEAQQHGDAIWIYPKFWKLPSLKVKEFTFAHEIGHYVLSEYGLPKFVDVASSLGIDVWDSASLPYAQYNMHEAFADSFAAYHLDRAELKQRYPEWEQLVELVQSGRTVTAAYSEDTLEIVAAGMSLILAQNYIVTNPYFDEKEIRKYLALRRQFHEKFVEACLDLADAFEEGRFGSGVKPAIPALRSIGSLNVKQEQQALRQMVRAFRGLRHLKYQDVDDPRIMRLITMARRLGGADVGHLKDFLESLVRVQAIPAPLRTLLRKVIKLPTPGETLYETPNPGAWFEMDSKKKENLRELAERTQKEQDGIYEAYKDEPEKRLEMYKAVANRLQKIQNIAGVNLGIVTKEEQEPLDKVLRSEAKLETDGPTEFVRLQLEDYVAKTGTYRYQRKEGEPLPREVRKLLTTLKKAKTFQTMRRIVKEAVDRQILGRSATEDVEHILSKAEKNRAIREGKPLTPIQFTPKTPVEFQVDHDTGAIKFDPEFTEDEKKELLGRVSRAITDLEGIFGKGFCGKHSKKLEFVFNKFEGGFAKASYFTWNDRNNWQPRVTFGPDYEGLLAHELSHYLGPGVIFGNTGVPLSRYGKDGVLAGSRKHIGKHIPEFVEFIDAVLDTPDYKRWEDKLGSAYDMALPVAIKNLAGISYYDLPKDHPYYGIVEKAQYRSDLPPELNTETQKVYQNMMGGDDRKLSYYNSAIEVWARMCEQYVYSKLIDAGISNPWLTQMSYDEDVFMDEKTFDDKVLPVMDRIFAKLKDRKLLAHRVVARYLGRIG